MFLHSKTIRYRLNKVEQLLDIDLANPLQLLNYEIATYIIKMRRRALENNQTLANGATVTIYPTTTEPTNYVVYLHGGGMIYGTKSDLPEELKELFTSNGYTVLALDYLLAPNTKNRSHLKDANGNLPIVKRRDYSKPVLWFCAGVPLAVI